MLAAPVGLPFPDFPVLTWLLPLIIGGVITVLVLVATLVIVFFVFRSIRADPAILQNGTPAVGTIVQVWQTGTYLNNNPQLGMLLEVRPPNGQPYQAQVKAIVPLVNIPQFQPGATVPVKIHPTDPSKVAIDPGRFMPGGAPAAR